MKRGSKLRCILYKMVLLSGLLSLLCPSFPFSAVFSGIVLVLISMMDRQKKFLTLGSASVPVFGFETLPFIMI